MNARAMLLLLALGCGSTSRSPTTTPTTVNGGESSDATGRGSGSAAELTGVGIALDIEPKDANVTLDEIVMGRADQLDPVVSLAPGLHTLVVEQAGFKSYRAEFSVTDKVEKFTVRLEARK